MTNLEMHTVKLPRWAV